MMEERQQGNGLIRTPDPSKKKSPPPYVYAKEYLLRLTPKISAMMHSDVLVGGFPDSFSAVITGRASEGPPASRDRVKPAANQHACSRPRDPSGTPIAALDG
jgi:hypothetical protein